MTKKLVLLAVVITALSSCNKNSVEISGILEYSSRGEYIFLDELKSNELLSVDSVMISADGSFVLKRKITSPSFYLLKINENNFLTMLLEPGEKIKMTSHHDSLNYPVVITGSKGTKLMVDYNKRLRKTINSLMQLNDVYMKNRERTDLPAVIDSIDNVAQNHLNDMNNFTKDYIDENISSLVSLVALYQQIAPNVYVLSPDKDIEYFKKVDSSLYSLYPEYEPVVTLHSQVQELVSQLGEIQSSPDGTTGKMEAPEIALPTPKGDTVRLSSTRGSIVLLDFWAAWCSPCRMENPNLVKAYETYHGKGFEIYQVSLDKTKEAWIKGIEEDKLGKWIHVSDVKYWNSIVVPLYKIESIPANFLLDKDGRIIASNLRGNALHEKLAELFR